MRLIIGVLFLSLFLSCNNTEVTVKNENINEVKKIDSLLVAEVDVESEVKETPFIIYFNKLPKMEVGYKADCYGFRSKGFIIESEYKPEGASILGTLKSFNKMFLIVYIYSADINLPILEFYNNDGQKTKDIQLFDYGFCTDLKNKKQHSSFEILPNNKVQILSYIKEKDSINVVDEKLIDLYVESKFR